MFGGVSLAVYINGVARELFRAVRGRGVYRLLQALTDSEIVVRHRERHRRPKEPRRLSAIASEGVSH